VFYPVTGGLVPRWTRPMLNRDWFVGVLCGVDQWPDGPNHNHMVEISIEVVQGDSGPSGTMFRWVSRA
jgi:hypothetical protein